MLGKFTIALNGERLEVTPTMADAVAYETTARRRHWGGIDEPTSQMTAATFLIWKALQRTDKYSGSFDEFLGEDIDLISSPDDDEEASTLDPM